LKWNFQKSSCLKLQAQSFHIWYIASSRGPLPKLLKLVPYQSCSKQIMPLGFSIIGSTVTFDLFLRWATQGPLGPLVYNILLCQILQWEHSLKSSNYNCILVLQNLRNMYIIIWLLKWYQEGSVTKTLNKDLVFRIPLDLAKQIF